MIVLIIHLYNMIRSIYKADKEFIFIYSNYIQKND